jgi:hypothetical protein
MALRRSHPLLPSPTLPANLVILLRLPIHTQALHEPTTCLQVIEVVATCLPTDGSAEVPNLIDFEMAAEQRANSTVDSTENFDSLVVHNFSPHVHAPAESCEDL